MLILVIFILIVALIVILSHWFVEADYHIAHLIACALVIGAWIGVTKINDTISGHIVHHVEKTPITALVDSKETNGAFTSSIFIGSGTVGENLYYYYVENTERGKRIQKVPADKGNAYIKEISSDKAPQLIFEYDIRENVSNWSYNIINKPDNEIYIFEVPNDTVTTEFNVDLK